MTIVREFQAARQQFEAPPAFLFASTPGAMAKPRVTANNDDECAPLANVVRQFSQELKADGLLAAWHEKSHDPVTLCATGDCARNSDLVREMMAVASQMVDPREDRSRSAWWAETTGSTGLLTSAIPSAKGVVTLTASYRVCGGGMRTRASETATRLLPLIQPFFRLWELSSDMGSRLRGLTAAINNSDVATVLVDGEAKLLFVNDAAETLLSAQDGLTRSGSTLRSTRLSDTLRLHAAIDHVLRSDCKAGREAEMTPVIALERKHGRPLLAAIVAGGKEASDAHDDVAIMHIFDPEQDLQARCEPACKLYGLSPVETRLACLLAGGASLADAAEAMHIRGQTARSYLKQIFFKTDTNRQAELVWMLLKSSVRTAPGRRTMLI